MRSHLKVKVFSLSAEMNYIHRQELKWKDKARAARQRQQQNSNKDVAAAIVYCESSFWTLRQHRQHLKADARWTHLAHGFMRGRPYWLMETICYGCWKGWGTTEPDWARIEEIVTKFSQDEPEMRDIMQKFSEWKAAALLWFEGNPDRIKEAWRLRAEQRCARLDDADYQLARATIMLDAQDEGMRRAAMGWVKRGRKWHRSAAMCDPQERWDSPRHE